MKSQRVFEADWRPLAVQDRMAFPVILAGIFTIVPALIGFNTLCGCSEEGNVAAAKAQIKQFETALVAYTIRFGAAPDSLNDLVWPPSGEPMLSANFIPLDPWGNPYAYWQTGSGEYAILSLGADGEQGGNDDDQDIWNEFMEYSE